MNKLKGIVRHPLTLGFAVLVGVGSIGIWQLHRWLKQQLPNWIAAQATQIIHRPVQISEVQELSLTQLTLGPAFLPATPQNPSSFQAQSVLISLDPWQLLHRGTLKTLIQFRAAQGQIHPNEKGTWLEVKVEEVKLPLPLDLTFKTEKAAIQVQNLARSPVVPFQVTGQARYIESGSARWQYAFKIRGKQTDIALQGETLTQNSQSQLNLVVKQLSLRELSALLPSPGLKIEQGNLIADLNLSVPSFESLSRIQGTGKINLNPLEARLKNLGQPLFLNLNIALQGQKIVFKNTQLQWGTLTAKLRGNYDFATGFNLKSEISLSPLATFKGLTPLLPKGISLSGQIQAQTHLTGTWAAPVLTGLIQTLQPLSVNGFPLGQLTATFVGDRNRVTVRQFRWLSGTGIVIGRGYLEPKFSQLWQEIANNQPVSWQKIPLHFSAQGKVSLAQSLAPLIPPSLHLRISDLVTQAEVNGNLGNPQALVHWRPGPIAKSSQQHPVFLTGQLILKQQQLSFINQFEQSDRAIAKIIGKANFQQHQWQLTATSQDLALKDYLRKDCPSSTLSSQAWCQSDLQLHQGQLLIVGKLRDWLPQISQARGLAKLSFQQAALAARLQWQGGLFTSVVSWDKLSLNPFLSPSAPTLQFNQGRLHNQISTQDLWTARSPGDFVLNLNAVKSSLQTQFQIGKATGKMTAILDQRQIKLGGNLPSLSLNALFPQIPLPVKLQTTHFQLTHSLDSFAAQSLKPQNWGNSLNTLLDKLQGQMRSRILVSGQPLQASATLQNNQWQAQMQASDLRLKPGKKLPHFIASLFRTLPFNAKLELSGNLKTLLAANTSLPITINHLLVASHHHQLQGQGAMRLAKSWTKPDVEEVKLTLQAHSPLSTLNFNPILDQLAVQRNLLPQNLQLQGQGEFRGQLWARQVFTDPFASENLQLTGQLNLRALQINRFAFESQLSGPIIVKSGQVISLNLRGQRDRIATQWQACLETNCPFSYLPQSLNIAQFNPQRQPLIIAGRGSGDAQGRLRTHFLTEIRSFPLELLELNWLSHLGLDQPLGGIVQGEITFKLEDKTALGNLKIHRPHFGFLQADAFKTGLTYADQQILLQHTILTLGKRDYAIANGSLNLRSGELLANLSITDANIPDLLQGWGMDEIEPLLARLQPSLGQSKPTAMNPQNAPLSEQLNQLWQVDRQLRQATQGQQKDSWPQVLDLSGKLSADLHLGGNLRAPSLDFQVQGQDWVWQTQAPAPALIDPLGLVIQVSSVIPFDDVLVQGNWHKNHFQLKSQLHSSGMEAGADLNLIRQRAGLQLESANFSIRNLSLDFVQNWIKFPTDISGLINLSGIVKGSFEQPLLKGNFEVKDLAWHGQLLRQDIAGKFAYQNQDFSLVTTAPDAIQWASQVSLPLTSPLAYPFAIKATLKTEALALLENLTGDRLTWEKGEGNLQLQAKGTLTLADPIQFTLDPQSGIRLSLANVALKTPLLSQLLNLDGRLMLKDDHFVFEDFKSNVGGQGIIIEGSLPLFPSPENISSLANPLTLTFAQREDDPSHLYRGALQGKLKILGSALTPILGGQIILKDGILSVPATLPERPQPQPVQVQWFGTKSSKLLWLKAPQFQDLEIVLERVELNQQQKFPRFAFNVSGHLTLNGFLNSLQSIEPEGKIQVNQGFMDFFPSRVFINQHQTNTLTFSPSQGILNPTVDLRLQMYLFDLGLITLKNNSIPDDLVQSWRSQSLLLNLAIQGNAAQLLPQQLLPEWTTTSGDRCPLLPGDRPPFPSKLPLSPANLTRVSDCIQNRSLGINSIQDLVRSPLVSISSVPPMTRDQYLTLFANQYANLSLQEPNDQSLVKAGLPQVGATIIPWIQNGIFDANMQFISWGNQIGLDTLQVYPSLSTQYRLDKNQVIRLDYDYDLNQARIRYQRHF